MSLANSYANSLVPTGRHNQKVQPNSHSQFKPSACFYSNFHICTNRLQSQIPPSNMYVHTPSCSMVPISRVATPRKNQHPAGPQAKRKVNKKLAGELMHRLISLDTLFPWPFVQSAHATNAELQRRQRHSGTALRSASRPPGREIGRASCRERVYCTV